MRAKSPRGFTLIEVLVALVILGIGISSVLVAYSGSFKLMQKASAYQSAVILARSKLDETWVDTNLDISGDDAEERYNGILYGYRITIRPVPIIEKAVADKVNMPVELQEILVEVFWGEETNKQRYALTAYRLQETKPGKPK